MHKTRASNANVATDGRGRLISTSEIVSYADEYLRIREIGDWPNAMNGLQVENSGRVSLIVAAVDVSTRAIQAAVGKKANLLIVHHGIFWPGLRPLTNALYRQIKLALEHDIAVYSAHLPLDLHDEVGNNVLLMRALGIEESRPFFEEKGSLIGRTASVNLSFHDVANALEAALAGPVKRISAGPDRVRRLGIITGSAGNEIERVAAEGIDTFITGEAPHWAAVAAEELGINLLLGGHYATETFGVKALAAHLAGQFQVGWHFVDLPTGL
jgi:dinuclear metal center protein, YbgI/SA1388 family